MKRLALVVLTLLGLLTVLYSVKRAGGSGARATGSITPGEDVEEVVSLTEPPEDGSRTNALESTDDDPQLEDEASEQRSAAEEPESIKVFGIVLDEHGEPMPGVDVALEQSYREDSATTLSAAHDLIRDDAVPHLLALPTEGQPEEVAEAIRVLGHSFANSDGLVISSRIEVTGPDGTFDFGMHRRGVLTLRYGASLFLGEALTVAVPEEGGEQILQLPARLYSGLAIELVGPDEPPKPTPEWASFDLLYLAEGLERGRWQANAQDVTLARGRIQAYGLAPGIWRVWIHCSGAEATSVELSVEAKPELTAAKVTIPYPESGQFTGSPLEPIFQDATSTHATRDPQFGFNQFGGDVAARDFGESGANALFGHSITGFGSGPVTEATLELVLEGTQPVSGSGLIAMEYRGPTAPKPWAWIYPLSKVSQTTRLRAFTRRQRMLLDLSNLPSADGPISLLKELEDGVLDLMIEDGVIVHSLTLRVYH
ncbi:MAG: hypothetical protein ACI9K5_003463 [Gammaproteobacteria bacterium]|jgi:hypothetical protein